MLHASCFMRKGQTAFTLIFIIGTLVVVAAVSLAFLALSFANAGYGFRASSQALAAAQGGVYDALLILTRAKDYNNSYTLTSGSISVSVSVTQNTSTGQATIVSTAAVSRYIRRLQATVSLNSSTGQVDLLSVTPLAL